MLSKWRPPEPFTQIATFFLVFFSNYDMYRSLYNYKGKDRGALPVRAGKLYTFIEQHDTNWWRMCSQTGTVGLVPACYLELVHNDMVRESLQWLNYETVVRSHILLECCGKWIGNVMGKWALNYRFACMGNEWKIDELVTMRTFVSAKEVHLLKI